MARSGDSFALGALVSLSVMLAPGSGHAANLLEILFGGPIKHRSSRVEEVPAVRVAPDAAPRKAAKVVPAAKISGPIYYTYKADPLQKVDFSALESLPQTAAFGPMAVLSNFREAAAGLKDFDLYAEKDIAKAMSDYYAANPEFIWVNGFSANSRAADAVRVLGEAASHGLLPAQYAVSVPSPAFSMDATGSRLAELARFEMTMSARVLRYVRDVQNGRINPNLISGYYDFPAKPLDLVGVLKALAGSQDVASYMESFHPQAPEYRILRAELETLSASAREEIVVDPKLLLRPDETSAELPKLIRLITANGDPALAADHADVLAAYGTGETYVPDLVPFIKAAQKSVGLKADGVIGPRTVAKFAGQSDADRVAKLRLALEELRWLPSTLGDTRVFINEPSFTASYFEDGVEKLKTRTVVGRPSNQTSFFYDQIKQVDFNPYWGIPQSILVNEMLPRLRRDPGYLDRSGYEVTDAKGRRVSSASIDWGAYGSRIPYSVRQAPSEANALGELKILFPNKHAIYMHDTPQKALFNRDVRAFSHGCVRLQDPRGMAAAVLGKSRDYVADKLKRGHSSEKVTRTIPVYVAYFTAWPNAEGKVEYFDDIYDRDDRLKAAMAATDAVRAPNG